MDRLLFKKVGRAKYISHLDLMRTFQRLFVRAGIKIKHTEGFNPHPYVSFALPLSLGTESVCELMDFALVGDIPREDIPAILNSAAPEGIVALEVYEAGQKLSKIEWLAVECTLYYDGGVPTDAAERISALFSRESLVITKKTKRGEAEIDVIPLIKEFSVAANGDDSLKLSAVIKAQAPTVSPAQLVDAVRVYAADISPDFTAFLRTGVFDAEGKIFR